MEIYSDGWDEFRRALTISRKTLLRKNNPRDGLPILKELSAKMCDQSQLESASLCYLEMANIANELGDMLQEKECLSEAFRLISSAYTTTNQEYIKLEPFLLCQLEETSSKMCGLAMRAQCAQSVGMVLLELASRYMDVNLFDIAYEYLIRAAKFLKTDFCLRKLIFKKMIICLDNAKSLAADLCDFTTIFFSYIKSESLNGTLKDGMIDIEIKLVLLHLKQYSQDWEIRPRSFLDNYSINHNHKTLMNKADRDMVLSLIEAYRKRDCTKMTYMLHSQFWQKLDDYGRKLMGSIIKKVLPSAGVLHEELNSMTMSDIGEFDKRRKMIEWYITVKRKSSTTFQTL